ncbi:MAG: hypothetical protein GY756_20230, partial [bacterium]|nr:hypothetical protein [bacterium]
MRNIKKYILFSIAQFILISSVYADSLVEKVTVKNSYMLVYINLNKTYNSPLSKYINERLKGGRNNKINQTELYRNIIKTLKK